MDDVTALATKIAAMPRLGLALTKQAINNVEELQGKRQGMEAHLPGITLPTRTMTSSPAISWVASMPRPWRRPTSHRTVDAMDLVYTEQQQAFRAEVRDWLAANVPSERLPSFDTAEASKRIGSGSGPSRKAIGAWSRGRQTTAVGL